jgi:muramidase (phage lysozyme)
MAGPFNTGMPVSAKRLPPHRVAFLNAIAGGESRGRYDIRYHPTKRNVRFTSFDKHPGIFEPGPHGDSSAAGRYMFTKTTWDDLGGGPFTKERQDENAWRLAEQRYRATTGRDLDADLLTEGLSPRIMSSLGPTWKAFERDQDKHQATFSETMAMLSGGAGALPTPGGGEAGGNPGDDRMEDLMAISPTAGQPGMLGGGGFQAPQAPQNRSQMLAMILENMQRDAQRGNPKSWAETGVRALGQGLHGYLAGNALSKNEAHEQQQREALAAILEGRNPEAAELLQSGIGGTDDWASAILKQAFQEPKEPSAPTRRRNYDDDGREFFEDWDPGTRQWVRAGGTKRDTSEKPTDRERRVQMLTETGVPEDIAKGIAAGRYYVSRHPVSQEAQVVDIASGQIVYGAPGNTTAGQAGGGEAVPVEPQGPPQAGPDGAMPGAAEVPGVGHPPGAPAIPSFVPEDTDPTKATGLSGAITGVVNAVSDLFGQGLPFPEHDKAAEALNSMKVYTMSALQAEIPGRPSQFLLERIEKLTVDPRSILRADERAINRLEQTRDLLQTEIDRIQRDIIARPGEFRPNELTNARLNSSQLQSLLRAYDTMLNTAARRRSEGRPGLEQFDRRR